jgi:hypothetical protein
MKEPHQPRYRVPTSFAVPYRMGDVVGIKLKDGSIDDHHIIYEVRMNSPESFRYSTNISAWHDHKDLVLIQQATRASLQSLWNSLREGEENWENEIP